MTQALTVSCYLMHCNVTHYIHDVTPTMTSQLTFKGEHLIPSWVEVLAFNVRRKFVFFVGKEEDFDVRVACSGEVLRRKFDGAHDAQCKSLILEVVLEAELKFSQFLAVHWRERIVLRLEVCECGSGCLRGGHVTST